MNFQNKVRKLVGFKIADLGFAMFDWLSRLCAKIANQKSHIANLKSITFANRSQENLGDNRKLSPKLSLPRNSHFRLNPIVSFLLQLQRKALIA